MAGGPRGRPRGNLGACRLQNLEPFDPTLGQVLDGENTHLSSIKQGSKEIQQKVSQNIPGERRGYA